MKSLTHPRIKKQNKTETNHCNDLYHLMYNNVNSLIFDFIWFVLKSTLHLQNDVAFIYAIRHIYVESVLEFRKIVINITNYKIDWEYYVLLDMVCGNWYNIVFSLLETWHSTHWCTHCDLNAGQMQQRLHLYATYG